MKQKESKVRTVNWGLNKKILISMLGCTLLAMILSSLIIYGRTVNELVQLNERYMNQNVKHTAEQMEHVISGALVETFACLHQPVNRDLILDEDIDFDDVSLDTIGNLQSELSRIVATSRYISAISLLKKNGSALSAADSDKWELLQTFEEAYNLIENASEAPAKSLSTGGWVMPFRAKVEGGAEKDFILSIRNMRERQSDTDSVLIVAYDAYP